MKTCLRLFRNLLLITFENSTNRVQPKTKMKLKFLRFYAIFLTATVVVFEQVHLRLHAHRYHRFQFFL